MTPITNRAVSHHHQLAARPKSPVIRAPIRHRVVFTNVAGGVVNFDSSVCCVPDVDAPPTPIVPADETPMPLDVDSEVDTPSLCTRLALFH